MKYLIYLLLICIIFFSGCVITTRVSSDTDMNNMNTHLQTAIQMEKRW